MFLLEEIVNEALLNESVSITDVNNAIDTHKRIILNYRSKGEDKNNGPRVVEVYAYGLTKAGNPVIRCFQPMGDTTTKVPSWKFFRLDRITSWKPTEQTFSRPADFYYKGLGNFNENGDETMSVVYKIASFGNKDTSSIVPSNKDKTAMKVGPKPKNDDVFKTDTEHRMERLRQQLNNPIKIGDLQKQKSKSQEKQNNTTGPKTKTDNLKKNTEVDNKKEIEQLRNKLGDTSQPIKFSDLQQRLKQDNNNVDTNNDNNDIPQWKKDVYDRFEPLRKQLNNNPRKIDLSKIPRR